MGRGTLKVACDDGFEVIETDTKELAHHVRHHLDHRHGGKEVSREDGMKMAKHP